MNHETSLGPHPLVHLERSRRRVMTARELRAHGVPAAVLAENSAPGGPWQQLLPQVFLLHQGPPTGEERLHAAVLYAGRRPPAGAAGSVDAMVTGPAALAVHRFAAVPPLTGLNWIDVLVPRHRRVRNAGDVRLRRTAALPQAQCVDGVPCAPVPRAIADAVAGLDDDVATVRAVLIESVRGGHCDAATVIGELDAAGLTCHPHVASAVDALLAEDRSLAERRLYEMVRGHCLPDPVWNVDLQVPGGPYLGPVDAYWPDQAVALELGAGAAGHGAEGVWTQAARRREHLERLGVVVVETTPERLRTSLAGQAAVVRTALVDAQERGARAHIVVLPR